GPFELVEIPMGSNGNVDIEELEKQCIKYHEKRPMIGSFSAASNVTGILSPVQEIHAILKKYQAFSFWDYAGAAPYVEIDMNPKGEIGKDALFISPHKLIGGPGTTGILLVKRYLFSNGIPVVTGGGTVDFVTKSQQKYCEDIEVREEGGNPAIIESIRAGMAFRLKDMVGGENIERIEHNFIKTAIERFKKHPNIFVLGDLDAPRLGFMAFNIRYKDRFLHHNFVVALLNDLFGIQSRGGCSCAGPYGHDLLNIDEPISQKYISELSTGNLGIKPGWVRLNFNYFIPEDEFNYLMNCMIWISENGWKLLNAYHFDDKEGMWHAKDWVQTSVNTIQNFADVVPKLKKGSLSDKKSKRNKYLKEADKIAKKELKSFHTKPLQQYGYSQIENPLRWFSLAQDVED
ncbi:MAG TPA: aminotransferase, partial [Flavobacteriales bacterium]|nr:aminotransferase [Flavobacteriales bacterium]